MGGPLEPTAVFHLFDRWEVLNTQSGMMGRVHGLTWIWQTAVDSVNPNACRTGMLKRSCTARIRSGANGAPPEVTIFNDERSSRLNWGSFARYRTTGGAT